MLITLSYASYSFFLLLSLSSCCITGRVVAQNSWRSGTLTASWACYVCSGYRYMAMRSLTSANESERIKVKGSFTLSREISSWRFSSDHPGWKRILIPAACLAEAIYVGRFLRINACISRPFQSTPLLAPGMRHSMLRCLISSLRSRL